MYTAYIGLGANLGDRGRLLQEAVDRIGRFATVTAAAPVYETEPVGIDTKHLFLNSAVAAVTPDDPGRLLRRLKVIERAMGRPAHSHHQDRVIDLDILMYDGLYYCSGSVEVPHPALEGRRFALRPLADIAPGLVHPISGSSVKALLRRCPDGSAVAATSLVLRLPS